MPGAKFTRLTWSNPQFSASVKMSGAAGVGAAAASAALYAVVSNPAQIGAQPEDAKDKKHHLKHGKGFQNPWESFISYSMPRLFGGMLWYVFFGFGFVYFI